MWTTVRWDFKPTALSRDKRCIIRTRGVTKQEIKEPRRDEPIRQRKPFTSSFRFSSENVHLLQHQTSPEESPCLRRGPFYSSDDLKTKNPPRATPLISSRYLFSHAESQFIREERKKRKRSSLLLPLWWDVQPLKADPLQTPELLLNPSVALIVCVAVNIL